VLHIYSDLNSGAAYAGSGAVYREARKRGMKISLKVVKEILSGEPIYTIFRQKKLRFPRRSILVFHVDSTWEIDGSYLYNLAHFNRGYSILLCVTDTLSGFSWVEPAKSRSVENTIVAMRSIFERAHPRVPDKILGDKATEYLSQQFLDFLKGYNVEFYTTYSGQGAATVENFQRRLKGKLFKYMVDHETWRFIDVLQKIVDGMNGTRNRVTKLAPAEVNKSNERLVWLNRYFRGKPGEKTPPRVYKFKLGKLPE